MFRITLLVLAVLALAGCSQLQAVTVKQLYADPVGMNGKSVMVRGEIIPFGNNRSAVSDVRTNRLGIGDNNVYVSLSPNPHLDYRTVVDIEGKYDGDTGVIHLTSCKAVQP